MNKYQCILYLIFPFFLFFSVLADNRSESFAGVILLLGAAFLLSNLRSNSIKITRIELNMLVVFVAYSGLSVTVFFFRSESDLALLRVLDDIKFVFFIPLYFLLRNIRINERHFVAIIFLFLVVIALVVLAQHLRLDFVLDVYGVKASNRPSAGVNPMRFALVALLSLLIVTCYLIVYGRIYSKFNLLTLIVLLAAGTCSLVLPNVRGVWLAIPFLFAVMALYLAKRGMKGPIFVSCFALVVVIVLTSQMEGVQKRIGKTVESIAAYQAGDGRSSAGTRLDMYYAALILIKEKPLTGYGLGSFKSESKRIKNEGLIPGRVHWQIGRRHTTHNEMLQALVEKGILGGILTILIFGIPMVIYHRAAKARRLELFYWGLTGMTVSVAFIVAGQTGTLLNHNLLTNIFIIFTFIFVSQIMRLNEEEASSKGSGSMA